MPPKCKFTKEEMVREALELVRAEGICALTARALAERLGASPKPIFGLFQNMEELQSAVLAAAYALYENTIQEAMQAGEYPPYKASGMAYILFAKRERELFKLLFMRDRSGETISEDRESVRPQLELIMKNLGISEDEAYRFHMEMWVYVHGLATMAATSYLNWDTDFISDSLSDVYQGLKYRYTGGK